MASQSKLAIVVQKLTEPSAVDLARCLVALQLGLGSRGCGIFVTRPRSQLLHCHCEQVLPGEFFPDSIDVSSIANWSKTSANPIIGELVGGPITDNGNEHRWLVWQPRGDQALDSEATLIIRLVSRHIAYVWDQTQQLDLILAGRQRAQALSVKLIEAQEAERRSIARELHDEIGQAITAARLTLQRASSNQIEQNSEARLQDCSELLEQVQERVRGLSLDLRPSLLDDLGLVAALRWYLDRQAQRGGFQAELTAPPQLGKLPGALEITCYRVIQEAVTNIHKHARASVVSVRLTQSESELDLDINDNGRGFDPQQAEELGRLGKSFGLLGMRERVVLTGGSFELDSMPGAGTRIRVRLPISVRPKLERRRRSRGASE